MTGATAPPLVVRLGESMFAFAPGPDITVGRDASLPAKIYKRHIRVDIAAKQAITRVHLCCTPTYTSGSRSTSRNGI